MVLNIRLTTDKVPEVFAVLEIALKDGTVVRTNAVLDKLERVAAIDLDPDEISSVKLVSMGFKPRD